VTIALTWSFTRWICFKCACITSRAEILFARIALMMSTAHMKQISSEELGVTLVNAPDGLHSVGLSNSSRKEDNNGFADAEITTPALRPGLWTA